MSDATQHPTVDDALREQTRATMEAELDEHDKARLRLLSLTAHELAAPTTTIKGYMQMLDQGLLGELTARQQQVVRSTLHNVERLEKMIRDLSDFAKLQAHRMEISPTAFQLHEIVYETVGMLMDKIREAKVDVQMTVSDDLPAVYADRVRVGQIVTNLLSNAVKYTPEGGHVDIRAQPVNGFVQLEVSDSGVGIAAEELARLFEPFFRSEDSFVRAKAGTGLGLVIVKMLVERHGGRLQVASKKGEGSTFSVTLPVSKK